MPANAIYALIEAASCTLKSVCPLPSAPAAVQAPTPRHLWHPSPLERLLRRSQTTKLEQREYACIVHGQATDSVLVSLNDRLSSLLKVYLGRFLVNGHERVCVLPPRVGGPLMVTH